MDVTNYGLAGFSLAAFSHIGMFVVLIPVAARLLANYLPAGGFNSRFAAAAYGMVLEGSAVSFFLMLEWALWGERTQPRNHPASALPLCPAREARPGTRSITSMARRYRSRSYRADYGELVLPDCPLPLAGRRA